MTDWAHQRNACGRSECNNQPYFTFVVHCMLVLRLTRHRLSRHAAISARSGGDQKLQRAKEPGPQAAASLYDGCQSDTRSTSFQSLANHVLTQPSLQNVVVSFAIGANLNNNATGTEQSEDESNCRIERAQGREAREGRESWKIRCFAGLLKYVVQSGFDVIVALCEGWRACADGGSSLLTGVSLAGDDGVREADSAGGQTVRRHQQ